jgi:hypothetical protein
MAEKKRGKRTNPKATSKRKRKRNLGAQAKQPFERRQAPDRSIGGSGEPPIMK